MKAYNITDPAEPHLSFREVIMEHLFSQKGYEYHISTFFTIIQGCRWLSPHIISSIIGANLVDALDVHEEIMKRFLVSDRFSEYWSARREMQSPLSHH